MKLTGRREGREEGAAYVEFLIAFLPFFILFLGMVQMALMFAADLVVQHAASRAARAAVVILDDDPVRYDGAARREITTSGSQMFVMPLPRPTVVRVTGGPRLSRIRFAAMVPLAAIGPSADQLLGDDNVISAIGSPETRAAETGYVFTDSATAVTFPSAPHGSSYSERFTHGQQVTARVTYLFHCGVPMANRLMCETYSSMSLGPAAGLAGDIAEALRDGRLTLEEAREAYRRLQARRRRTDRDREAMDEMDSAGNPGILHLTSLTGARFKVLRGEATMPLQSARYEYR